MSKLVEKIIDNQIIYKEDINDWREMVLDEIKYIRDYDKDVVDFEFIKRSKKLSLHLQDAGNLLHLIELDFKEVNDDLNLLHLQKMNKKEPFFTNEIKSLINDSAAIEEVYKNASFFGKFEYGNVLDVKDLVDNKMSVFSSQFERIFNPIKIDEMYDFIEETKKGKDKILQKALEDKIPTKALKSVALQPTLYDSEWFHFDKKRQKALDFFNHKILGKGIYDNDKIKKKNHYMGASDDRTNCIYHFGCNYNVFANFDEFFYKLSEMRWQNNVEVAFTKFFSAIGDLVRAPVQMVNSLISDGYVSVNYYVKDGYARNNVHVNHHTGVLEDVEPVKIKNIADHTFESYKRLQMIEANKTQDLVRLGKSPKTLYYNTKKRVLFDIDDLLDKKESNEISNLEIDKLIFLINFKEKLDRVPEERRSDYSVEEMKNLERLVEGEIKIAYPTFSEMIKEDKNKNIKLMLY